MSYEGGYSSGVNQLSEMQSRGIMDAMRRQAMEQQARQVQARQSLGGVLGGLFPGGATPPPQVPPPPGTPAGGPMPPGVGVSSQPSAPPAPPPGPGMMAPPPPMAQAGAAPPMAGAPGPAAMPQAPPPIPPFRAMPTAPAAGGAPGEIPPPPGPPPAAAAPAPAVNEPKPINLQALVDGFKKAGIPQDRWMDMLTEFEPVMNAQNRSELNFLQANNKALKDANDVYLKSLQVGLRGREVDVKEDAEARRGRQGDRKLDQGEARLDLLRRKIESAAGGSGKLEGKEYIYPKNAEGKIDQTLPPIGIRGTTKSGKIIYLDVDGAPTTAGALAGGTQKEDKGSGGGKDNVRTGIVRSGVVNSLNRLDEIEKAHPKGATSVFFGTHADGPVTRGLHGVGQGMQSKDQQDIDAKWAAFIDEAIPVFTGGLRGSDAFRRFLIEQAPGPGARPETIKEKMRLFRENINGTSKAFFSKFKGDPSMWATGTKPEEVQGAAAPGGEPAAGQFKEGQTASGPGGQKIVFRGGKWTPQ